jgi:hypothetical protein
VLSRNQKPHNSTSLNPNPRREGGDNRMEQQFAKTQKIEEEKIVSEIFEICKELDVKVDPTAPDAKNKYLSAWHKRQAEMS